MTPNETTQPAPDRPASVHIRRVVVVASCVLALFFAIGMTRGTLGLMLTMFGIFPLALTAIIFGIVTSISGFRLAYRSRANLRRAAFIGAAAPAALLVMALLALPALQSGAPATDWLRLLYNRSTYEHIIAAERTAGSDIGRREYQGIEYDVHRGPPVRIAFHPYGMLDNWSGIVFDPTRRVGSAQGWGEFAGDYTVDSDLKSLFGGDLVSCTHMMDDYFRCSFT